MKTITKDKITPGNKQIDIICFTSLIQPNSDSILWPIEKQQVKYHYVENGVSKLNIRIFDKTI